VKVYNLTARRVEEYNDSYAARLIEQGKAIPAQKEPEKAEAPKETEKAAKADSANQNEPSEPESKESFFKGKGNSGGKNRGK